MNKGKKIGLALGGGAVLGAAHIGIIRAIEELEIPVKYIAGTSIGALVAALYAFGLHWEKIKDIALELDWMVISELSLSQFGLLKNKKIEKVITKNIGDVKFEDANIPLEVVATDIASGKKVIISTGSVAEAVMASTCIPGIFIPIKKGDQLLVDGGVIENVPVPSLQSMGSDYIIGVDLNAHHTFTKPKNIIEVLISTIYLTLINVTKLQTEKADLLITPDLSQFNLYDTKQIAELIEKGYTESRKVLENIFG
ncbi:MAG: patatin-like phospholipase family protein [Calditrichaceae bacterium]|jgi:NTE family protein